VRSKWPSTPMRIIAILNTGSRRDGREPGELQ
jgi:hypothetical protein